MYLETWDVVDVKIVGLHQAMRKVLASRKSKLRSGTKGIGK